MQILLFNEPWYSTYKEELRRRRWQRFLKRHKPTVTARLERLNPPDGPEEGGMIRGLRYKNNPAQWFHMDLVSEREFVEKWGDRPREIAFKVGRKKYVTRIYYKHGC